MSAGPRGRAGVAVWRAMRRQLYRSIGNQFCKIRNVELSGIGGGRLKTLTAFLQDLPTQLSGRGRRVCYTAQRR